MKEFTVSLGGRERRVRYTSKDGIALEKAFGKSVPLLLQHDLVGQQGGRIDVTLYRREVQVRVLFLGLVHDWPKLIEDQVYDLVDAELLKGRTIRDIVWNAYKAALYAGLTGRSIDVDTVVEALAEDEKAAGDTEGNAEAPGPSAS
jgi:hypothetical protein